MACRIRLRAKLWLSDESNHPRWNQSIFGSPGFPRACFKRPLHHRFLLQPLRIVYTHDPEEMCRATVDHRVGSDMHRESRVPSHRFEGFKRSRNSRICQVLTETRGTGNWSGHCLPLTAVTGLTTGPNWANCSASASHDHPGKVSQSPMREHCCSRLGH